MGRNANVSVTNRELRSCAHETLYLLGSGNMVTIVTGNPCDGSSHRERNSPEGIICQNEQDTITYNAIAEETYRQFVRDFLPSFRVSWLLRP